MEKTLSVILIILALLLGIVGGVILTPSESCEVCQTCKICPEAPVCEVCEVCEIAEPCEATPNEILNVAIEDVLNYLENEDEFICDGEEYDRDEVDIRSVNDEFSIEYDDDEYEVSGSIKLNFKQDEEKRCRDTIDFKVFYEPEEEPEITIL